MATRGRPPKYPWRTMEVGDTFLAVDDLSDDEAYTRLKTFKASCWAYSKKLGRKFSVVETIESIAGLGTKTQAHVVRTE